MRRRIGTVCGVLATLALSAAAVAQEQPATRHVHGWVKDTSGRPVPGLVVTIAESGSKAPSRPTEASPRTVTDEDGFYWLDGVPAGDHGLFVSPEHVRGAPAVLFESPTVRRLDLEVPERARVRILLRGPDDEPVADARVRGHWRDLRGSFHRLEARSDATGALPIETLGGMFESRFQVEAAGYAEPQEFAIDDFVRDVAAAERWTLARGVELTGVVTGPDGPVAGATVCLATPRVIHQTFRSTTTDDEGRYRFDGVPPGASAVRVTAAGLVHASHPSTWCNRPGKGEPRPWAVRATDSEPVTLDVALVRGRRVRGTVRDEEGRAVSGANVWISQRGTPTQPLVTDELGRYDCPNAPPVPGVRLSVHGPGVPTRYTEVDLPDGADDAHLDVTLPKSKTDPSQPSVRIRTADGRVPPGVRIESGWLWSHLQRPSRWIWGEAAHALDGDRVLLRSFRSKRAADRVRLRVRAPGFAVVESETFDPRTARGLPDLVLEPTEVRAGRVIDAFTKEPIAGAWIVEGGRSSRPGFPGPELRKVVRAVTAADGSFALPAGDRNSPRWYTAYAAGHVSTGFVASGATEPAWEIRLPRSHRLTGRVRDVDREPVAGALVGSDRTGGELRVMTDEQGRFSIPTVPGYAVSLFVRPPPRRRHEFGHGDRGPYASDARDVPIRLPERLAVRLTVRDPDGEPIADASGELLQMDGRRLGRFPIVPADDRGELVFAPADPGRYRVVVAAPGFETAEFGPVTTEPGQEVALRRLVTFRRTVRTRDGTPVAHARWRLERVGWRAGLPRDSNLARRSGPLRWVTSDADGAWEVQLPRGSSWRVVPGYDLLQGSEWWGPEPGFLLDVRSSERDEIAILGGFRLLTCAVHDDTGAPCADARLRVNPLDSPLLIVSRTDEDGVFRVLVPTGKRCRVSWEPDDRWTTTAFRTVEPHVDLEAGNVGVDLGLRLHRRARLAGRLRDARGRPAGSRRMRLDVLGRSKERVLVSTEPDGSFSVEFFPCGSSTAWLLPGEDRDGEPVRIGTFEFDGTDVDLVLPE